MAAMMAALKEFPLVALSVDKMVVKMAVRTVVTLVGPKVERRVDLMVPSKVAWKAGPLDFRWAVKMVEWSAVQMVG